MPKVRKPKQRPIEDLEKFASASDDSIKNKKDFMIRTTISFTENEHEKLKQIAKQERRTLQAQVRHLLKEYLN